LLVAAGLLAASLGACGGKGSATLIHDYFQSYLRAHHTAGYPTDNRFDHLESVSCDDLANSIKACTVDFVAASGDHDGLGYGPLRVRVADGKVTPVDECLKQGSC